MNDVIEKTIFKDLEIKELSPTSKIYLIGRYAEIIFRFDQKLNDNEYFTLGKGSDSFDGTNSTKFVSFKNHFDDLRDLRNKCVHTQNLYVATAAESERAMDDLLYLYSFLFFKYFLNFKFGSNEQAMELFSILPPKIRCITLVELLKYEKDNIFLIDKAMLALIKSDNLDAAVNVLEENSEFLNNIKDDLLGKTYYTILKYKLNIMSDYFSHNKKMYSDLPEAGTFYRLERDKYVSLNDKNIDTLVGLMDFVYKGF